MGTTGLLGNAGFVLIVFISYYLNMQQPWLKVHKIL